MSNIPQFTADENLTRIIMDKNNFYLLVEGASDMTIYSEVVYLLIDKHKIKNKPITVFGGGKSKILAWIENNTLNNVSIILDMDFDDPQNELNHDLITPLERYSIENYFFEESIIVPLISFLLKRSPENVSNAISLAELREHWFAKLTELIPVVFYYQKRFEGNKNKWSSVFINKGSGNWEICDQRVSSFKSELLKEMEVEYEICKEDFVSIFGGEWCPCVNFPGKILFESFNQYLRHLCENEKRGSYGPVTSKKSLIAQLASRLIRNLELERILLKALPG